MCVCVCVCVYTVAHTLISDINTRLCLFCKWTKIDVPNLSSFQRRPGETRFRCLLTSQKTTNLPLTDLWE